MYDELCEQLGATVVDSFIEHNILHLRPTRRCTYDKIYNVCPLKYLVSHNMVLWYNIFHYEIQIAHRKRSCHLDKLFTLVKTSCKIWFTNLVSTQ